jgi:predicted pyridoxine 5'-phosphate oxidase superfamily flavin-nucleotide-binding protein
VPGSIGEHALQERYGTTHRARGFYDHQVLDHLNEHMQTFLARMEMVFIATADAAGEADCSFRAGPPGFVCVLDERTLAYPEYRGNGVMASLGNIAENAHIGLLFIDFCGDAIGLHVNGRASIVEDDALLDRWVHVDVVDAYVHCAKHIPRLARRPDLAPTRPGGDYFRTVDRRGRGAHTAPLPLR